MSRIDIQVAPKAKPLLDFSLPVDRWFLYGGRKTFKSYSFALKTLLAALWRERAGNMGTVLCARATQASLAESMLAEAKSVLSDYPSLAEYFRVGEKYLKTEAGRVSFVFRGTNINPSSLKGVTGAFMGGVDEADECTEDGLRFFEPTIRVRKGESGLGVHYLFNPSTEETPMAKCFCARLTGLAGARRRQISTKASFARRSASA